ncbi:type II toxin-antitoxin system PemK/MazF family toxin [Oscillospiraceae bacterium HCP3S3_F4]
MKENWNYRRGDIYLVDLGTNTGSEQGGCRPVLLLQNDVGNHYAEYAEQDLERHPLSPAVP